MVFHIGFMHFGSIVKENNKLNVAIKHSLFGKILTYILQFLSLAVYSRVFTPEQFGIIASIQVFVIFFQMLADVGIGPAIINEKKFQTNQRDGVFSLTLIIAISISILGYSLSPLLNDFYGGYDYQDIGLIVSVALFFYILNIVPTTSFNKDAKFIVIAKYDIILEFFSLVLVLVLFYLDFGVLALASKSMFQSILRFLLFFKGSKETTLGRPKIGSELYHIRKLFRFSAYQFGFNFINYFSRNLDNILIAKYFGVQSVGVYEKSYQLMRYPLLLTTLGLTRAIQPILTKHSHDTEYIVKEHNSLTKKLLLVSVFFSIFIYFNANSIVLIMLGDQWLQVVPLIKIFSFVIPVQSVLSTSGSFFQVMNQTKLLFISGVLSAVFNVSAIFLGVFFGDVYHIAIFLSLAFTLNFFQAYYILFKFCFRQSQIVFYKMIIKTLLVSFFPSAAYFGLSSLFLYYFDFDLLFNFSMNLLVSVFSLLIFLPLIRKYLSK